MVSINKQTIITPKRALNSGGVPWDAGGEDDHVGNVARLSVRVAVACCDSSTCLGFENISYTILKSVNGGVIKWKTFLTYCFGGGGLLSLATQIS